MGRKRNENVLEIKNLRKEYEGFALRSFLSNPLTALREWIVTHLGVLPIVLLFTGGTVSFICASVRLSVMSYEQRDF